MSVARVAPEERRVGKVHIPQSQGGRVKVRGLDHDKSVRGPEVDERAVSVEGREKVRPAMAVGQQDDRQIAPRLGHRDLDLERHGTARYVKDHRAVGDDGARLAYWNVCSVSIVVSRTRGGGHDRFSL